MADEHEHGSMDTTTHEKTFAGFVNVVKWVVIGIVVILLFLAIFRT
ncbi:MAG: aa3-type cytochrome c oxidase subunit IV [Jannaschia sp.]